MAKQGGKDGKELRFPDMLKSFFGISKSATPAQQLRQDSLLTPELFKDIGRESSIGHRLKAIKQLTEDIPGRRLEDYGIENVWFHVEDLFQPDQPRVNRVILLNLIRCIARTQFEWLGNMRAQIFRLVKDHDVPEDLVDRLEILDILTKTGREVNDFEHQIGRFLARLMPESLKTSKAVDVLKIHANLIKFNSAFIDEDTIEFIVIVTCEYALTTKLDEGVELSLEVLEGAIGYSYLPSKTLHFIIPTLCQSVNVEKFFKPSLKLVRNLLGTNIGCSALYTLCYILQFRENLADVPLVRGAVFFIGMALWGTQKITSLKFSPCVALPFFRRALSTKNLTIASEIGVSMQRLVAKYGPELHQTIWDLVMDLLEALLLIAEDREVAGRSHCPEPPVKFVGPREESEEQLPARKYAEFHVTQADISNNVHEIINNIEQLYEEKKYKGCEERFFAILDKNATKRPESSVLRLITFRTQSIHPLNANWLLSLSALVERFFKQENKTAIRVKMIDAISFVIAANRSIYEDDITEKIVLPAVSHIESESDPTVRNRAVELLVDTALDCSSKICVDILDILERVVLHPFDPIHHCGGRIDSQDVVHIVDETAIVDVKTAVEGLLELFRMKFYVMPTTLALNVFKILISHLQAQYHCSPTGTQTSYLRAQVFDSLMRIRSHTDRRLGLLDPKSGSVRYSSYIFCSTGLPMSSLSPLPMSPNPFTFPQVHPYYFSVEPLFQAITICLKQEKDWSVLKTVLAGLTRLLRDKLLVSGCTSISSLCSSVCGLVSDRNLKLPDSLRNIPADFQRSDFSLAVLQVIAGLVSYHKFFDSNLQKLLVKCLQCGLTSKSSCVCILNLTVAILEMPDTLYKMLPEVLLALSKISATVAIAIPVLEFLSTLICLPKLFASFVQDQYMSIFAIALPYTNPFKFNHYVVSLAHHVIAMWFLKCKLPFRKGFVKFIMKGLKSNIVAPSGDIAGQQQQSGLADDDLSAKGSRGCASPSNEEVNAFHVELTETCVDLLARYTFASCSVIPKRTPLTEFLLSQGQKSTWLMGNTLVTVTTSGCASRTSRYGVCEKCASVFKSPSSSVEEAPADNFEPDQSGRRRHRSAVMRSLSGDQQDSVRRTQDDMLIKLGTLGRMSSVSGYESKASSGAGGASASDTLLCSCWYPGWAEILVRRPSGNISWVMRIENQLQLVQNADMPLTEVANLVEFGVPVVPSVSESSSKGVHGTEDPVNVSGLPQVAPSQEGHVTCEKSALATPLPASESEVPFPTVSAITPGKQSDEDDSFVLMDTPKKESPSPLMTRPARTAASLSLRKLSEEIALPRSAGEDEDTTVGGAWSSQPAHWSQSGDRRASMAAEKAVASSILHQRGSVDSFSAVRTSCPELKKSPPLSPNKAECGDLQPIRRDRGHTISVMSPAAGKWTANATVGDITSTSSLQKSSTVREIGQPTGVNPSFVFLQLYHNNCLGVQVEKPVLLPKTEAVDRGIKNLDRIPPYETHKIGVVYVGPEQVNNEAAILGNEYGSVRYMNFLSGLGRLIRLEEVDPQETYVGGLEQTGNDGKFAYIWQDDVMQVIFHVATLMPTKPNDPSCVQKKLHIGNDFVTIVYNDSRQEYDIHTIKGQFIYACVVIEPLDFESSLVTVKTKQDLNELIGHSEPKIVMDTNAAVLVRQLALHSNLASMIIQRHQRSPKDPYASNWLERLRHIKRLKSKFPMVTPQDEDSPPPAAASARRKPQMDDFTTFV